MSKDLLLIAAVAGAAVLMLNKAKAQVAPAGSRSAPTPVTNVNNQLWASLLGGAWTSLTAAQNADGSPAFLKRNFLGQVTTTDGKPVSEEIIDMFPHTYGNYDELEIPTTVDGGTDYLSNMGFGYGGGFGSGGGYF